MRFSDASATHTALCLSMNNAALTLSLLSECFTRQEEIGICGDDQTLLAELHVRNSMLMLRHTLPFFIHESSVQTDVNYDSSFVSFLGPYINSSALPDSAGTCNQSSPVFFSSPLFVRSFDILSNNKACRTTSASSIDVLYKSTEHPPNDSPFPISKSTQSTLLHLQSAPCCIKSAWHWPAYPESSATVGLCVTNSMVLHHA